MDGWMDGWEGRATGEQSARKIEKTETTAKNRDSQSL